MNFLDTARELERQLEDGQEDEREFMALVEKYSKDLEGLLWYVERLETEQALIKEYIDGLRQRKSSLEKRVTSLKKYIAQGMASEKVSLPIATVSVYEKEEFSFSQEMIPHIFWRALVEVPYDVYEKDKKLKKYPLKKYIIDESAVKDCVRAGNYVEGVKVEKYPFIKIYKRKKKGGEENE